MDKKTGYPHIDKPWMKYYDEELINSRVFPHKTLVDFMKDNLKEEKADIVAHDYYGFQRKFMNFMMILMKLPRFYNHLILKIMTA